MIAKPLRRHHRIELPRTSRRKASIRKESTASSSLAFAARCTALLTVVACGGTHPAPAAHRSPTATATSTPTGASEVRGPTSPPADSVGTETPIPLDVPALKPTLPAIRETAIGYQSPQEQTRHGKVDGNRWLRPCRGTPLHHCAAGFDPECTPTVIDGHQYRVRAETASPHFTVFRDRDAVYRGKIPSNWANPPIYTLAAWQDSWVVEAHDELIVNGESLNQKKGYRRAFNWVLWHDLPLYFFERDQTTQISYGDVVLPAVYDEVAHNLCCSEAMHTIINCSDEISFYARRGPKWYYVQLTP